MQPVAMRDDPVDENRRADHHSAKAGDDHKHGDLAGRVVFGGQKIDQGIVRAAGKECQNGKNPQCLLCRLPGTGRICRIGSFRRTLDRT
ncbi:hypothetical protein D3C87_1515990 [compost metagenome]